VLHNPWALHGVTVKADVEQLDRRVVENTLNKVIPEFSLIIQEGLFVQLRAKNDNGETHVVEDKQPCCDVFRKLVDLERVARGVVVLT